MEHHKFTGSFSWQTSADAVQQIRRLVEQSNGEYEVCVDYRIALGFLVVWLDSKHGARWLMIYNYGPGEDTDCMQPHEEMLKNLAGARYGL
jgi:hypothetical protein